jgi:YHS domain-containing protein
MKHIDPVCGMVVKEEEVAKTAYEYKGETYYFCCAECEKEFKKDPEKYLNKKEPKSTSHECCR